MVRAAKLDRKPELFKSRAALVFPSSETDNNLRPNNFNLVKQEPIEYDSLHNSLPNLSDPKISKSTLRKEQEKNVKSSAKKSKNVAIEAFGHQFRY